MINGKKVLSLVLATGISAVLLTGCTDTSAPVVGDVKTEAKMVQVAVEDQAETRVFAPYEHVYFKRYDLSGETPTRVMGGQVTVPFGYEILDIEPFIIKSGYGSRTGGFDVWFINNQEVEATSIYNKELGYYDFSEPGVTTGREVETEKTLKLKR